MCATLLPSTVVAQAKDTVTLNVGDARVDGRVYKPHLAAVTLSVTKDGKVIELHDGSGRAINADVEGARIRATMRPNRDTPGNATDVTISTPAYMFSFLGAAIGATSLIEPGRTFRLPTFDISPAAPSKADWHTYKAIRRDSVNVQGHWAKAWIVGEEEQPTYIKREIWLTEEPPYLPLGLTYFRDGRVQRFESILLHNHP